MPDRTRGARASLKLGLVAALGAVGCPQFGDASPYFSMRYLYGPWRFYGYYNYFYSDPAYYYYLNEFAQPNATLDLGFRSVVAGGRTNSAPGAFATVGGGLRNIAMANHSAVGGGHDNSARTNGTFTAVLGGFRNKASGASSLVLGGDNNRARADAAVVLGGSSNTVRGDFGAVIAGEDSIVGELSFVGGGSSGSVDGKWNTMGMVYDNYIYGSDFVTVLSGEDHEVFDEGHFGFIGAGENDYIYAHHGSISSGYYNVIGRFRERDYYYYYNYFGWYWYRYDPKPRALHTLRASTLSSGCAQDQLRRRL